MTALLSRHLPRGVKAATFGILAASTLVVSSACSSGDDGGSGDGETVVVKVKDMEFDPASVTIKPGDTVKWEWEASLPHDVVSDDDAPEAYNSELITEGEYSYTYEEAGTYGYHCTPHPTMTGEVIVEE